MNIRRPVRFLASLLACGMVAAVGGGCPSSGLPCDTVFQYSPAAEVSLTPVIEFKSQIGCVAAIGVSASGDRIVAGGSDGMIEVYDVASGARMMNVDGGRAWIESIALSPDGLLIAAGDEDGGLVLWDMAEQRERVQLVGHHGDIQSLAFAPDGASIWSSSRDGQVIRWSTDDGSMLSRFLVEGISSARAKLRPDDGVGLFAMRGGIHIVDLNTGKPLRRFRERMRETAAFDFDDEIVCAASVGGGGFLGFRGSPSDVCILDARTDACGEDLDGGPVVFRSCKRGCDCRW